MSARTVAVLLVTIAAGLATCELHNVTPVAIGIGGAEARHELEVATVDPSAPLQPLPKRCEARPCFYIVEPGRRSRCAAYAQAAGTRHERPRGRAAEKRDEIAAPHSITSSARASSVRRHFETERFSGLEVDDEFVLGWRLHRKVGGLLALEDAIDVDSRAPVLVV